MLQEPLQSAHLHSPYILAPEPQCSLCLSSNIFIAGLSSGLRSQTVWNQIIAPVLSRLETWANYLTSSIKKKKVVLPYSAVESN